MKVEWDKQKDRINVEKHGLSFSDASKVFESPMLVKSDERKEYGETRWMGIGLMDYRVVVFGTF